MLTRNNTATRDNANLTKVNIADAYNLTQISALVVITIPPYKSTISGDR